MPTARRVLDLLTRDELLRFVEVVFSMLSKEEAIRARCTRWARGTAR
jgi:hypothetical protein